MIGYSDETYLHYVEKLEKKADRIVFTTTMKWMFFFGVLAYIVAVLSKEIEIGPTVLIGVFVGVFAGVVAGEGKAIETRAEVQRMLCNLALLKELRLK